MLRAILIVGAALACFSIATFAQTPPVGGDKKPEPIKGKEESPKGKSKELPKDKTPPINKLQLPKEAILIVVDDLLDAMGLFPKMVMMSFEEYVELQAKLKNLERQVKSDKKIPFSCKLHVKLEGDFLICRADYGFSTEMPKSIVHLGLKGGHLLDEGDLDGQAPILDFTDDGFIAKVEKEGTHQLSIHFRVPVEAKRPGTGVIERSIDLGLPGAAVTILSVELPANVKELRWNESVEKTKTPGRWQIGLEKAKALSLSWKEPAPLTGNTPLAKVDGQINVRVEEAHVSITGELVLEDIRPQTKEWHLFLPGSAKITEVKTPSGQTQTWTNPDATTPFYKISDVTPGKWQVSIVQRLPRPGAGARLPVGQFHVIGAFQHQGVITVQSPAEVTFGQRLVFARSGQAFQTKNTETEAEFRYSLPSVTSVKAAQAAKAPIELEWRNEMNQLATDTEHTLKLKPVQHGWELEATTRIQVSGLFAPFNAVEVKLPITRPGLVPAIGTASPGQAFPGTLPWAGLWRTPSSAGMSPGSEEVVIADEKGNALKVLPLDGSGRMRVLTDRAPVKKMTLVLKSVHRIPPEQQRLHVGLPRPVNSIEHKAKVDIQADERIELLHGPAGAEEPVPDRHSFVLTYGQSPEDVDIAWRPHRREVVARSTVDITLHEHTAQVRQSLRFPRDRAPLAGESKPAQVAFKIPRAVEKVNLLSGGEITNRDAAQQLLWIRPKGDEETVEIVLEYDLIISKKKKADARSLATPLLWPTHVSQKEVKVRVWSASGLRARLLEPGNWKERSTELVAGQEKLPLLVLQGYGANLPLTLVIDEGVAASMATFVSDRALIQVQMADDDSQTCRARYVLRKVHAPHVDVELPLAVTRLRDLSVKVGKTAILPERKPGDEKSIRISLHPELLSLPAILEIRYTIPPDGMDRNYFWKTTMVPPAFPSDVVMGQVRWQFATPTPTIATSFNRRVRPDWQWGVQNWLPTPESSLTSAELETWLTGADGGQGGEPVTYVFAHNSAQPVTVYHLTRTWWLLGCSGLLLIVALGAFFSPLPRWALWLLALAVGIGGLVVEIVCPALLPPLLFGAQPGLVLLVIFITAYWLMQERYRRQLVFLPGFARTKSASTVVRSSAPQRARETSTLEAPPAGEATESNPPAAPSGT